MGSGKEAWERKDGKRNGVGLYTYSNGDQCRMWQASDIITLLVGLSALSQYEGEWKNGKKHGQGIMTFSNGAK
eukprot:2927702-Rhodomonas_salina.1